MLFHVDWRKQTKKEAKLFLNTTFLLVQLISSIEGYITVPTFGTILFLHQPVMFFIVAPVRKIKSILDVLSSYFIHIFPRFKSKSAWRGVLWRSSCVWHRKDYRVVSSLVLKPGNQLLFFSISGSLLLKSMGFFLMGYMLYDWNKVFGQHRLEIFTRFFLQHKMNH